MEIDFKNTVVLKDLPSNIVKEAYVVFKSSKMARKIQKINKENQVSEKDKENRYAIKEAELLILEYTRKMDRIDKNKKEIIANAKINKKLKKYAYIASIIIFIQFILLLIK